MSPYLFAMNMDVLACGIKDLSQWCMIFADDIVLRTTRREEVEKKLRQEAEYQWKGNFIQDVNVHRNLDGNSDINLHGDNLERVVAFKYLGSTLSENGDLDGKMTHIIQPGWTQLEERIVGSV